MTAGLIESASAGEPPTRRSDFAPLLEQIRAGGLLRTRRLRYAGLIAVDVLALALVWGGVYALGRTWWALFLALPAAVFTTRLVFIGHDVGHGQISRSSRTNNVMGWIFGDFLSGLGSAWWIDKHTRHHANPNHLEKDPDVEAGALAWTSAQAAERTSRIGRWAARHQARLYFPMVLFEALNLKATSFRAVRNARDLALLVGHVVIYLGGLLLVLGPGRTAVFVAIHQSLVGLHLGVAFAPNHKGMETPGPDSTHDFVRRQVLTSRNVRGHRATDWFLGGLNYQIEHHLFPSMARPHLRHAQGLVRAHCGELGLPYASETLLTSMVITVRQLHSVGAAARSAHSAR